MAAASPIASLHAMGGAMAARSGTYRFVWYNQIRPPLVGRCSVSRLRSGFFVQNSVLWTWLRSHMSTTCSHSSRGITPRMRFPPTAYRPDLDPRGAGSWHGSPFLHGGLKRGSGWFVHMSVGFMYLNPYWQ